MIDFEEVFRTNPFMRYFMKFPVFLNFGMLFMMNFSFFVLCLHKLYTHMHIILIFIFGTIHEILFILICISLYRAYMNDPGYVSKTLKHERSELFVQVKKEYDQEEMKHSDKDSKSRKLKTMETELENMSMDIENQSLVKLEQATTVEEGEMKSRSEKKANKKQERVKKMTEFRYCKKCDNLQPPRSDHCGLCGKCVLRMDHHCPWIGNCVGFGNHKNFVLFIFYTGLCGCLDSICYFYGWFNQCYGNMQKDTLPIFALIATIMSLMGCFTLIFFGMFTIFLIMRNLLSSEMSLLSNPCDQHPFDKSTLNNIKEVMGENICRWGVPEKIIKRSINGIDY